MEPKESGLHAERAKKARQTAAIRDIFPIDLLMIGHYCTKFPKIKDKSQFFY
jgi:hypothetical protein